MSCVSCSASFVANTGVLEVQPMIDSAVVSKKEDVQLSFFVTSQKISVVVGRWLLVAGCSLLVVGCWLLVCGR